MEINNFGPVQRYPSGQLRMQQRGKDGDALHKTRTGSAEKRRRVDGEDLPVADCRQGVPVKP